MNYTEATSEHGAERELERLDGIAGLAVERRAMLNFSGPTGEFTRS